MDYLISPMDTEGVIIVNEIQTLQAEDYPTAISTPLTTEKKINHIQKMHLKHLSGYHDEVNISEGEINTLKLIAESERKMSGYARSLYYQLQGERIPFVLPDTTTIRQHSLHEDGIKEKAEYMLYPNPVRNLLTIEVLSKKSNQSGIVYLYDMHGRQVLTKVLESTQTDIDVSKLPPAIYLVRIIKEDGNTFANKIIIQ
jgi:hypothetical protein